MYSVNTYETVIKFCMMIFRLYAFLERLYYRLMCSLLVLVRYRNSGAFSVEAKIYGFRLRRKHPNFLIARGVPPCLGPWGWGENA